MEQQDSYKQLLFNQWRNKSTQAAHAHLQNSDIEVTNLGDKTIQLEKLQDLDVFARTRWSEYRM